jgi:exodeoxyribonuclease VII small subunit
MSTKKTSYREAYSELESILEKLENNELDVDQLTEQVKRASELIKFCRGKLFETESEIEKIMDEMDSEDGSK